MLLKISEYSNFTFVLMLKMFKFSSASTDYFFLKKCLSFGKLQTATSNALSGYHVEDLDEGKCQTPCNFW